MHLDCKSDRLAFSQVKLREEYTRLGIEHFQPVRWIAGPISNRFRRERMFEFARTAGGIRIRVYSRSRISM
jgi:hypothetical protein